MHITPAPRGALCSPSTPRKPGPGPSANAAATEARHSHGHAFLTNSRRAAWSHLPCLKQSALTLARAALVFQTQAARESGKHGPSSSSSAGAQAQQKEGTAHVKCQHKIPLPVHRPFPSAAKTQSHATEQDSEDPQRQEKNAKSLTQRGPPGKPRGLEQMTQAAISTTESLSSWA